MIEMSRNLIQMAAAVTGQATARDLSRAPADSRK